MYSREKHTNSFNSHLFTLRAGLWRWQKSLRKLSTRTSLVMPPHRIQTLSWWIDCQMCLCQGDHEASCCWVIYRTKLWKRDTPLTDDSSAAVIWSRVDREVSVCLSQPSTALLYVCVCVCVCVCRWEAVQAGVSVKGFLVCEKERIEVLVVQYRCV